MSKAADERWENRLQVWASYMLATEHGGGAGVLISGAYSLVGRGPRAPGDGVPIYVGEALDTHDLYRRLASHLQAAVWTWYVETGSAGEKAARLSIHRDTLADRIAAAKLRLEDLYHARRCVKSKTLRASPQTP